MFQFVKIPFITGTSSELFPGAVKPACAVEINTPNFIELSVYGPKRVALPFASCLPDALHLSFLRITELPQYVKRTRRSDNDNYPYLET